MTSLLTLMALTSSPAHAWKHTTFVWNREDFPVQWYFADGGEVPGMTREEVEAMLEKSVGNWGEAAPCAQLESEYIPPTGEADDPTPNWSSGFISEGKPTMYVGDPAEDNDESALAVTYTVSTGDYAFDLRDPREPDQTNRYTYTFDSDIVWSSWVDWVSSEQIDSGDCSSQYGIEATSTHEFGHWWGLGHSCEEEDVENGECNELDLQEATMFWTGNTCDLSRAEPNEDDITSINFLYGPYATFVHDDESTDRFGGVPLEVCFDLETKGVDDEDLSVLWNFGDGNTSEEFNPCHTYTEKGQYTVFITVSGDSAECGDFEYDFREPAFVLACEAPAAAEGFGGMFTYEAVEGTTYQMVNQADTSVYGCIDQVQWDVLKGGEVVQSVGAWSPKIDFGEPGTYEVVLNLGGPGGITAESLTIEVTETGGTCSAVPAAAGGLFGLLAGLGAAIRRRRD